MLLLPFWLVAGCTSRIGDMTAHTEASSVALRRYTCAEFTNPEIAARCEEEKSRCLLFSGDVHEKECLERKYSWQTTLEEPIRAARFISWSDWVREKWKTTVRESVNELVLRREMCDLWWERGARVEEAIAAECRQASIAEHWLTPGQRADKREWNKKRAARLLNKSRNKVTGDDLSRLIWLQMSLAEELGKEFDAVTDEEFQGWIEQNGLAGKQ